MKKDRSKAESTAAAPTTGYSQDIDVSFIDEEGLGDETIIGVGVTDMDCVESISSKEVMWWSKRKGV